jgi:hypothetical protein
LIATYVETNCTNPRWASHDSPIATGLPGGHSEWEPPDPFSNSEVKTLRADASVDFVDVKVGHCQALKFDVTPSPADESWQGFFLTLTCLPNILHFYWVNIVRCLTTMRLFTQ